MTMTYKTVSGTVTRPDSNIGIRAKVTVTPLSTNHALTFTGDDRITVGPVVVETASNGVLPALKIPTNVDLSGLVWRITAEAIDPIPGMPKRWTVKNAVSITGTGTALLRDLAEVDVLTVDATVVASVSDYASAADASKTAAAGSATTAAGWADAAASSAADADTSADLADTSADTATTAASTATTKATEASTSATTATTKASEAAASASHAEDMAGAAEAVAVSNDTIIAGRINDPASATATALTASYAGINRPIEVARPFPAVDIFGDSITAQNGGPVPSSPPSGSTYPAEVGYQSRGYLTHALTLLNQRARWGTNFGIGGQTTAQIKARIADVLASPNPIVVVYCGINDVGNSVSTITTRENLRDIYNTLRAAGKTVIAATIGPSLTIAGSAVTNTGGIASGVSSFTAVAGARAGDTLTLGYGTANAETVTVQSVSGSGPYTINLTAPTTKSHSQGDVFRNVTRLASLHTVNAWIRDYSRGKYVDPTSGTTVVGGTSGVYLVDWYTPCADPTTGQPYGQLQFNGSLAASPFVGAATVDGTHPTQDLAHTMGWLLALVLDRFLPPAPRVPTTAADPDNLLTNPRLTGNSSGKATGLTISASSGTFTNTPTKVARTDGMPGETQQVAVGPGNTGQGQITLGDVQSLTFDGVSAYVLEVEFETDPNLVTQASPSGGSIPLAAQLVVRQGSTVLATSNSHIAASSSDGAGSIWDAEGVLRTYPIVPPNTANRIQANVLVSGVDAGTFRVKAARVRKVNV